MSRALVAEFISSLTLIYTMLLIAAIVISMFQSVGGRIPYNRALRVVLDFVDEVTAPVLNACRRILPPIGPLDLSPMIAIIGVQLLGRVLIAIILA